MLIRIWCCVFFFFVPLGSLAQDNTAEARKAYAEKEAERRRYWQKKEFDKAVVLLEEMRRDPHWARMPDLGQNTLYNLACAYSLLGKKDQALAALREVIDSGFTNYKHLAEDPDLANIRQEPEFRRLLAGVTARLNLWQNRAVATPYRENLSPDEKIAGLSVFWSEVKFNFAFFEKVSNLDWDALYLGYLPKVQGTRSTFEYYRLLEELCAQLKDSHTYIVFPRELGQRTSATPGIRTRLIEGKVLISAVIDPSLREDGIRPGMEITAIDGMPVHEFAERNVMPRLGASTKQFLEYQAYGSRLLAGARGTAAGVTVTDENGKVFEKSLPRGFAQQDTSRKLLDFEMLPDDIGRLALNTFMDSQIVTRFVATFDEIQKSRALILDLRQNSGGNSGNGTQILKYFFDKPFVEPRCRTRAYRPTWRAWGRSQQWEDEAPYSVPPNGTHVYDKPVVVLTSAVTCSAAEDFLVSLDAGKRVTIIGEPTCGSTGQPLFVPLPGGGQASICTRACRYPDGKEFVGVGIQPHIAVAPTVADFRSGRDRVLEAALERLRNR